MDGYKHMPRHATKRLFFRTLSHLGARGLGSGGARALGLGALLGALRVTWRRQALKSICGSSTAAGMSSMMNQKAQRSCTWS